MRKKKRRHKAFKKKKGESQKVDKFVIFILLHFILVYFKLVREFAEHPNQWKGFFNSNGAGPF